MDRYQPSDGYINVHIKIHSDGVTIVIPIRLVALSAYVRPQFHLSNVISYRTRVQLQRQCFLKNKPPLYPPFVHRMSQRTSSYIRSQGIADVAGHLQDVARVLRALGRDAGQWQDLGEDADPRLVSWLPAILSLDEQGDRRRRTDGVSVAPARVDRQRDLEVGHAHVVLAAVHREREPHQVLHLRARLVYHDAGHARRGASVSGVEVVLQVDGHRHLEGVYDVSDVLLK